MTENIKEKTILVVDDSQRIRDVICFALKQAGYSTIEATDGRQAIEMFHEKQPTLIVLDIVMPEMDGTDVCREIRKTSEVPILFLSSRSEEVDRIVGLELGGDDYITKPFSPRELIARIKAVLRRVDHKNSFSQSSQLGHGLLQLDTEAYKASWNGQSVVLTSTEFELLRTLLGHPHKVYSRNELMDKAYGIETHLSDRTIDSHLRRIRKKFLAVGAEPIETVHGVGYKLGSCE